MQHFRRIDLIQQRLGFGRCFQADTVGLAPEEIILGIGRGVEGNTERRCQRGFIARLSLDLGQNRLAGAGIAIILADQMSERTDLGLNPVQGLTARLFVAAGLVHRGFDSADFLLGLVLLLFR